MWWTVIGESQKEQTQKKWKKTRTKSTKNVSYWGIALELRVWSGYWIWGWLSIEEKNRKFIPFLVLFISFPLGTLQDPGLWYQAQETKGALLHLCPAAQLFPEVCLTIDRKLHDKQAEWAARKAGPLQTGVILCLSIIHTYCVELVHFQGPHQLCMSNVQ